MAANTVYTFLKEYNKGDIVFRAGEKSDCMFEVEKGRIDLYIDYGGPGQKKIAEVGPERVFGEMGMVEGLPRSATAVVGTDFTTLAKITWDVFGVYFRTKPARIVQIMQQMGDRLRITTRSAMDLRNSVLEAVDVIQEGGESREALGILKDGIHAMDDVLGNNK
jgi:CRP-like cAMP-binding protein